MKKHEWVLRPVDNPEAVKTIQQQLNDLPEALARTLVLRGIDNFDAARRYFRPLLKELHDPFSMKDMGLAANRVAEAIHQNQRVLVYGDYDVDGTTSTALMTRFLRAMGVDADYFIPNRFKHGYGLNKAGIDHAIEWGARLIVTIDCGITAIEEAAYAREQGIDLVICDHHTAGEEVPDALAVLDPKRPDCSYPYKELSGCGVAFKLVQAVLSHLGEPPARALDYLDLVAISTASDIVPLTGENRILMREGLNRLSQTAHPGLLRLAALARLDLNTVTVDRIVFTIGPRINAAGRMDEAGLAVDLMLTDDDATAAELARKLDELNQQRRALDREIQDQAIRKAEIQLGAKMQHALVLHEPEWHQGIIGIVASRLVDRFHRPSVMLCTVDGMAKGSARSIPGINIYNAIKSCEDLLVQFGGHDYAAGLTLPEENVPELRKRLNEFVENAMTPDMMMPTIDVDAPLSLSHLDKRFWAVLKQFAPFGPENMTPIFHARELQVVGRPKTVGSGGSHLKLSVRQKTASGSLPHDVIGFGLGEYLPAVLNSQRTGQPLELLFSVGENTWNGRTSIQLRARDIKIQDA